MGNRWHGVLSQVADERAEAALYRYFELMMDWNERLNLTAITDPMEVAVKHFWDSLSLARLPLDSWFDDSSGLRVVDVGTGAGLPGIPLAICFPQWQFVLCDALNKRLKFLQHVVDELKLNNVELVHGRAEDLARLPAFRNRFDLVVSRAVARLSILLELTVPFCRPGGQVVAYKGSAAAEEVAEAEHALKALRAKISVVEPVELPLSFGSRYLVAATPASVTPKAYPRKAGTPKKQPL